MVGENPGERSLALLLVLLLPLAAVAGCSGDQAGESTGSGSGAGDLVTGGQEGNEEEIPELGSVEAGGSLDVPVEGERRVKVLDSGGALVWAGEVSGDFSFSPPLNSVPGRYEVVTSNNQTLFRFEVENREIGELPWVEDDAGLRERYVYPNAIGSGEIVDWRGDEKVQNLALQVVENASTEVEAYRALANFTAGHVKNPAGRTFPGVSPPTESCRSILRGGSVQGDCTEAALLLVALSRSVGIPARYVMDGGLDNYGGDDSPGLDGHSWAEGRVGGRWVMADATPDKSNADLHFDEPGALLEGQMATVPAAYRPTGREYLVGNHLRNGWVNGEMVASRYLDSGHMVLDMEERGEGFFDVKFNWPGKGEKVVLQSGTETTPRLHVSVQSVSDGRYYLRFPGEREAGWTRVKMEAFSEAERLKPRPAP